LRSPRLPVAAIGGGVLLLRGREGERGRKKKGERARGVDCLLFI